MTLIYFDGFQDFNTSKKPEVTGTATQTTGRDGSTNGAVNFGVATSAGINLPSACATCIWGMAFNLTNNPTTEQVLMRFYGASGTLQLVVCMNSLGLLELRRTSHGGTILATSTGHDAVPISTWRSIEAKVVLHTSSGSAVVKLDGVTVINYSGVTSGVDESVASLGMANAASPTGAVWVMDDLYVCDAVDATATQGRANNDFLGDLKVTSLIPSANGDLTAWTKSTGTNAAALVDEVPPNTTDYISSLTAAQRELMTLPDLPATTGNVYGLRVNFYAAKTDAGLIAVKPLIKESGGTITAQTAKPMSVTYTPYAGEFLFTKPSASTTPWSLSDINALQAGVELA